MEIFGYKWTDSQGYLIMWVILTILLVLLAGKNSGLAMGFALTILFAIAITVVEHPNNAGKFSPDAWLLPVKGNQ